MFGSRKTPQDSEQGQGKMVRSDNAAVNHSRTAEASPRMAQTAQGSPQRIVDIPRAVNRRVVLPGEMSGGASGEGSRTLRVGKGLSVSGEITSCDILVVEGKVEAKLNEGKMLEITEAGQFRGSVEIENADIAGRYDGQLIVRGRLTVRATGRVSGVVKYGELEVVTGGQIIGELQVLGTGAVTAAPANTFKNSAKFATYSEEQEGPQPVPAPTTRSERRTA